MPVRYQPGNLSTYFPVTCSNCGYTIFVNANVSGIAGLPKPPALESSEEETEGWEAPPDPEPKAEAP